MPGGDWIPHREQDFTDVCLKWKAGLSDEANVLAFAWKEDDLSVVLTAITDFLTARTAYEENDSSKNRLKKDEAMYAARGAMRDFANTSLRFNKRMRSEDKLFYGLRSSGKTRAVDVEPTTYPEAEADTSVIRQITIHFWDSATKKRGKPRGIHGAEIRWALLDHAPVSEKELIQSDFDTATPFTLKFDESDRGKRLYFCLRWESNTNLKGPYGEIYSAIIP
ncbi:MAG: hypothetical protein LBD79_07425 [Treponema sp.]|jgi:hypothetical protein|nr:hypothetical protein [Treponema sp.]